MQKDFSKLSPQQQEHVRLLNELVEHKGWKLLVKLIKENEVTKREKELTTNETVADVNGLDSLINHSFKTRRLQSEILLFKSIAQLPASFVSLIAEAQGYELDFDPFD